VTLDELTVAGLVSYCDEYAERQLSAIGTSAKYSGQQVNDIKNLDSMASGVLSLIQSA
jgi:hypothetical protein